MDTATLVAVLGFCGTLVASAIAGMVAIVTNRAEKKQTAETTLERTLRERLALRDEQNMELKEDLLACRATLRERNQEIRELKAARNDVR